MEFNTLLEHFGRRGYDVTNTINVFLNSKKQIVLRMKKTAQDPEWTWTEQTNYKFKMPSTIHDVSNIIRVAKSIRQCPTCRTIHSEYDNINCPKCDMKQLIEKATNASIDEIDCSLCGNRCLEGLLGKNGKTKLICGHQMCNNCFEGIKKNGQRFICTDDTVMSSISCPFCRHHENVKL